MPVPRLWALSNWHEHRERVAKLADSLRGWASQPTTGRFLALNFDRYTEYFHAVWWAGAAVVPMNIRWTSVETPIR